MLSDTSAENASVGPGASVTFAHISDLHLPPPALPWRRFLNKRLLSRHYWQQHRRHQHLPAIRDRMLADITHDRQLNALLITGDLTNFGTPEEFSQAAIWLKTLPLPALLVPGNHDAMVAAPYAQTGKLWEPWSAEHYPYIRHFGNVAVIGLNSAVPTPPFMAYGHIGAKQLTRLGAILATLKAQNICRILMLHHPPQRGLDSRLKSLRDTEALGKVLQQHGTELVLHGHTHQATLSEIGNANIPLLGVGATSMKHDHPERMASWNRICITRPARFQDQTSSDSQGWQFEVTRRSAEGAVLQNICWNSEDFRASLRTTPAQWQGGKA
ncbi:metallophosphoesterase family protein [Oecophyllibacter saccharovorans]|uniref:Metallophosphoesterase n=1 Tax=Oecophyllibacter saccharovorans TaxID=2558360 RepID=A0A506UQQ7_9PROT|nr:metallophosphoesterase [Oecophyllibacter saccharovorans]TPW35666.1 metallophosphoesterase [Oecophyllibacter saccharovorans]